MGQLLLAATLLACTIPLQATRTSFVTTVQIGDSRQLRFLVDTGASMTVINRDVASELGIESNRAITAVSTTGSLQTEETHLYDVHVGDWKVAGADALITKLPSFRNHGHLDGIVGMRTFDGHAISFDVEHRCVELDAPPPRGAVLHAQVVADRVAIDIDGLNVILDSGASFPVLMSARARALASVTDATEITSAAGTRRVESGVIPTFRIGDAVFRDVAVAFAPMRDEREDALIPITLFRRVYMSARRDVVIIAK